MLITRNSYMKNCRITVIGKGNQIDLGKSANYLKDCHIYIHGDNNLIRLGERNVFRKADLYIEDSGSEISFGNNNHIMGFTHIAALEGKAICFGDECLFSTDVIFRNSDSHAIYDSGTGTRINPAESILVGNRVWFGNKTTVLKGAKIGDNSVVATGAIVTHNVPSNSIVAGVPAKVVKSNIIWRHQRN